MSASPMLLVRTVGQKLLAILLPFIFLWLVWTATIEPVIALSNDFDSQRRMLLSRMAADQREISLGPSWSNELKQLQRVNSHNQGAREESDEALAAAGLQNDVQAILNHDEGQVLSVQIIPPTTDGQYETVSIQFSVTVPIIALPDFLQRVETHVPYMFIEAATFHAPDAMAWPSSSNIDTLVNIEFTLISYRRQ